MQFASNVFAVRADGFGRRALALLLVTGLIAGTLLAPIGAAAHGGNDNGSPGRDWSGGDPATAPAADAGQAEDAAPVDTGNATSDATATVAEVLNLRAGPSTDSEILAVMPAGAGVELGGDAGNGFVAVTYQGTGGYAASAYIAFGGSAAPAETTGDGTVPAAVSAGSDIVAIIYAAADAYGQSREDMLRVATCESGLDPTNVTPPYDASGLFQFLPSTWASTPYADQDIFDPVASSYAAAWMWSVGRRGEWVCQ